jgi:hypothetical protein
MNTRTITLTFTGPCVLKLEVPNTTTFAVAGEEVHDTPTVPDVDTQAKIYNAAMMLAGSRSDYAALRDIRNAFGQSYQRSVLVEVFKSTKVNADEFLGLLLTNGETQPVAQAIYGGINTSLGQRGEANL